MSEDYAAQSRELLAEMLQRNMSLDTIEADIEYLGKSVGRKFARKVRYQLGNLHELTRDPFASAQADELDELTESMRMLFEIKLISRLVNDAVIELALQADGVEKSELMTRLQARQIELSMALKDRHHRIERKVGCIRRSLHSARVRASQIYVPPVLRADQEQAHAPHQPEADEMGPPVTSQMRNQVIRALMTSDRLIVSRS